jgi:hypothetical protein
MLRHIWFLVETQSQPLRRSSSLGFDRIISYYATINNADQLMNVTAAGPTVSTSITPAPEPSSTGPSTLTTGQLVGLVVGVIVGVFIYVVLAHRKRQSEAHHSIPNQDGTGLRLSCDL